MTWSSAVCDITWDVTRRLLNLICVDLWEFESKKVRFVAERPLEAEQRGNLSVKLLQNDDMSRTCGLSGECYQDPTSAFWPFSQVPMSNHHYLTILTSLLTPRYKLFALFLILSCKKIIFLTKSLFRQCAFLLFGSAGGITDRHRSGSPWHSLRR